MFRGEPVFNGYTDRVEPQHVLDETVDAEEPVAEDHPAAVDAVEGGGVPYLVFRSDDGQDYAVVGRTVLDADRMVAHHFVEGWDDGGEVGTVGEDGVGT
ncbi:hypothetical protein GCM10029964_050910 [Kibdelosporangium lantanae]